MSRHYPFWSFTLATALALSFCAQARAQQEDAVVVTASRIEQQIEDAIPNTTVITARQIRDSGAPDLSTLLRGQPGVEIAQSGGLGGASTLFLRGGSGNHALVLIDGMRIESATLGTASIEHLMLDEVERVEIVRGNVSALYGSGAMGGVVQVFTRSGAGAPGASVSAMAGSRGTHKLGASYSGRSEATRYSIAASQLETAGFSAIDPLQAPGANPDRDGYRNTSVSGLVAQKIAPGHELGLRFFRARGRTEYDNAFGAPTDLDRSNNVVRSAAVFLDSRLSETWRSRLTLAGGGDRSTNFANGASTGRYDTRNRQTQWQNDISLTRDHTLTASAEHLAQQVDSTVGYARTGRDVDSLSLGYSGRFAAHQLQAGARQDRYSDFGTAATGLVGYGYSLTDAWKLTAMKSTAFRAPTFNELFWPADPVWGGGGNPNLRSERSRSSEAGIQYAHGTRLARVVFFRTVYSDLIAGWPPVNVARAHVSGTELTWSGEFAGWRARLNMTHQNPIDDDTGQVLRRRARNFGSAEVSREIGDLRIAGEVISSGARPDFDIVAFDPVTFAPVPVSLESYTLVNLGLRYRIDKSLELSARAENVTDRHYQLAHGYNTAPRGVFLGLRWQPAK
ncbi:MAG: TonB-dependent receptor [Betaproteobacteria bacterium]|nr:TonB-dependent receptor [Betaproteobacteria bacterium]